MDNSDELVLPALELSQGKGRKLYSFAVDGKLLSKFTTISRIHLSNGHDIVGYQRPEVTSHIADIRAYLETKDAILPTNLVVAFDETVTFESTGQDTGSNDFAISGLIRIPTPDPSTGTPTPGWIVDGQQRAAAIRQAKVNSFPIFVTGFIAASDREQREQFILVNSPKPLPKDLIYELLPGTDSRLPALLERRRFSATLLGRLNHDDNSPLKGMVRTPTNPKGVIKDNSILRMLENSLSDGALYKFRVPGTSDGDVEAMLQLVKDFWAATARVFPDAWGLPPRHSRLMHGAGILSMGLLMDAASERSRKRNETLFDLFFRELEPMRLVCHWTEGTWCFADGRERKWNEVQNIPKDIQMLAIHLLTQYQRQVLNAG